MKTERLPKNARCWIPRCGKGAELVVSVPSYGEVVGFCLAHRPDLRISVAAGWAGETGS